MAVRRARADWQKQARRQDILDAAGDLFAEGGGELPSVAAVAARAGLAKGTVYLYFQSKEEVFLALLEWRKAEWMAAVGAAMEAAAVSGSMTAVLDAATGYLLDHPEVLRLASYGNSVLERNVEPETALGFKQGVAENLALLGGRVEAHLPGLEPGAGARLLLRTYAYAVGLWQLAEPPAVIRELLQRDDLAMFRVDFAAELRAGVAALWSHAAKSGLDN